MSFVAVAVGVAGVGMGIYQATQSGGPSYPNLAASSAQMATTEAELLPIIRQMQAQAELGGTVVNPGYTLVGSSDSYRSDLQSQISTLQQKITAAQRTEQTGPRNRGTDTTGPSQLSQMQNQLASLQRQLAAVPAGSQIYKDANGNIVPASQAVTDFSGMSQADIQGKIMQQLTEGKLATEKQFDPQFIAEALKQEQLANPQGVAAREALYNDVQKQLNTPPSSPVADELQRQTSERVGAGSGLTPEERAMLDKAVTEASGARGGGGVPTDFSKDLTTGFAGTQRALQNAGAGTRLLASGETPEDIAFRKEQQDIANLSQFYSGQTPQAQFKQLSGASVGATPIAQGSQLPGMDMNAATRGASAGVNQYEQQIQSQLNQPNPWMTGLSGILGAANVAGSLGWQPLAAQIPTGIPGA